MNAPVQGAAPRLPVLGLVAVLTVSSVLGLAAGAAWSTVRLSPHFVLAQIEVEGEHRLDADEVRALSLMRLGRPLAGIDTAGVVARLERTGWIASARVERHWPDTLFIDIEERAPRALVLAEGLFAMDDQGYVFKRAEVADRFDLPVVTGIPLYSGPEAASARLFLAARLLDTIEHHAPELVIDELHQDRVGRWSIVIDDGREIVLGPASEVRPGLERYAQLGSSIAKHGTSVLRVDVSDPVHAYVRFAAADERDDRTGAKG